MPVIVAWILITVLPASALAAARKGTLREYSALELLEIENDRNEKGQKLPDEVVPDLRTELLYAVAALGLFHRVEDHIDPDVAAPEVERTVQMKLRIIGYSGSRSNASVRAMAHFIDKESGAEIFQRKVDATLYYDSGAMTASLRKLCRSTAKLVRGWW